MSKFKNLVIEPLNRTHDRLGFQCGAEMLDQYIKKQATQDMKRNISRVFVAIESDNPKKVIGYYTLSSLSIEVTQLPEKLAKKLPKHQIPGALLGRLAVCRLAQGDGIGKMLLADAIKRTLAVSDDIAIYALVVDAINQDAQNFYMPFGFKPISDNSLRLFLPLQSIM